MTMRSNLRVLIDYLSMVVDNRSALDFYYLCPANSTEVLSSEKWQSAAYALH